MNFVFVSLSTNFTNNTTANFSAREPRGDRRVPGGQHARGVVRTEVGQFNPVKWVPGVEISYSEIIPTASFFKLFSL